MLGHKTVSANITQTALWIFLENKNYKLPTT